MTRVLPVPDQGQFSPNMGTQAQDCALFACKLSGFAPSYATGLLLGRCFPEQITGPRTDQAKMKCDATFAQSMRKIERGGAEC